MKREYNKEYKISYSKVNQDLKLGVYEAFDLTQDTVTEYFESFGGDNIVVKNKDNAAWVVSKARVHFNKFPSWRDVIKGKSYTTMVKPIRVETETAFRNENNEILFVTTQQTCVIDIETRKIRKVNSVTYPADMETEKSLLQGDYLKLNDEFSNEEFVYEQKIYSQDIDYSKHTNNSIYVRLIMNALPSEFFTKNKITDLEIHYINESKEGQILKIYKKEENGNIKFLIKNDEKEIIRANLIVG